MERIIIIIIIETLSKAHEQKLPKECMARLISKYQ